MVSRFRRSPRTKATKKKGKGGQTAKPAAGSAGPLPRTAFTAADQQAAAIANMPDARFWADSESEYLRALPPKPGPWLILSTGGEDGAFGAGLLGGWSKTGNPSGILSGDRGQHRAR